MQVIARRAPRGGHLCRADPLRVPRRDQRRSSSSRPRTPGGSCPSHLEPVELHHGTSIFSMTAFDFTESEVGPYGEVVMSVIVSPLVKPRRALPEVRLLPLPGGDHHPGRPRARHRALAPAALDGGRGRSSFSERRAAITAQVRGGRRARRRADHHRPLLGPGVATSTSRFMKDDEGAYLANITMEGTAERARGGDAAARPSTSIPSTARSSSIEDVYDVPFREMWMRERHPALRSADPARDRLRPRPARAMPRLRRLQPALRKGARRAPRGARARSLAPAPEVPAR